ARRHSQVDRTDGWPPIRTPATARWTEPRLQTDSPPQPTSTHRKALRHVLRSCVPRSAGDAAAGPGADRDAERAPPKALIELVGERAVASREQPVAADHRLEPGRRIGL